MIDPLLGYLVMFKIFYVLGSVYKFTYCHLQVFNGNFIELFFINLLHCYFY